MSVDVPNMSDKQMAVMMEHIMTKLDMPGDIAPDETLEHWYKKKCIEIYINTILDCNTVNVRKEIENATKILDNIL